MLYNEDKFPYLCYSYIRKNLGGVVDNASEGDNTDNLKKELEESKAKIAELKSKLLKYEQTKDEAIVPTTE
jgi:cell shape-determining protein MreC